MSFATAMPVLSLASVSLPSRPSASPLQSPLPCFRDFDMRGPSHQVFLKCASASGNCLSRSVRSFVGFWELFRSHLDGWEPTGLKIILRQSPLYLPRRQLALCHGPLPLLWTNRSTYLGHKYLFITLLDKDKGQAHVRRHYSTQRQQMLWIITPGAARQQT